MRNLICLGCFWLGATVALAQTKYTPISNLNQPTPTGYSGVFNAQSLAASFTTGNTTSYLAGVSVSLAGTGGFGGHFVLGLYSDAGGSPGSSLATLSGNPTPRSAGIYTYTNLATLALAPATTYWIVASSPDATSLAVFDWNFLSTAALDAGSFWTIGSGKYTAYGVWTASGFYQQFSVTVTNPVPPAISIMQPVMLTFPVSGFPFVLQQSASLAGTNWVAATNAIQMATVNANQTVFLAPPAWQQMFYRLSLP